MQLQLYGLLHLCEEESSAENIHLKNFRDQISVYVNCAINLSNSLKVQGIPFTLLTNRKDIVQEIVDNNEMILHMIEIPFKTKVPKGIIFYSAHFKLDAFRYISSLNESYVGLCDLDMVCINKLPSCLYNNINQKIPMFYDISDQVIPAYGNEIILKDLELIHGIKSEGRWSGGEFIAGTPEFFLTLTKEIDKVFENYINNIETLHHIGDEAITSAALEIIRKKGTYIADAGTLGIIGRFWNSRVLHPQKPFIYFHECFLLHLPADKRFLVDMVKRAPLELSKFVKYYNKYRFVSKIKKAINHIMKIFTSYFSKNTSVK